MANRLKVAVAVSVMTLLPATLMIHHALVGKQPATANAVAFIPFALLLGALAASVARAIDRKIGPWPDARGHG